MKFIVRLILIATLCYFLSFIAPWWIIIIIGLLVGFVIPGSGFNIFLAGLLGGGMVWMGYSYKLYAETQGQLSEKMINMLGYTDPILLVLVAGIIGGVSVGLAGLTGNNFRKLFMKKVKTSFYN